MSEINNSIEHARDRLTDRVLAEAVGGETPPDLSEPIADRLAEAQATVATQSIQSRRAWITLLATAASLMIAVVVWRDVEGRYGERAVARVDDSAKSTIQSVFTSVEAQSNPSVDREEVPRRLSEVETTPLSASEDATPAAESRTKSQPESLSPESSQSGSGSAKQQAALFRAQVEVLDLTKLRDAERPIGAGGGNTQPANGVLPKISYSAPPETKRRLQEREKQPRSERYARIAGPEPFDAQLGASAAVQRVPEAGHAWSVQILDGPETQSKSPADFYGVRNSISDAPPDAGFAWGKRLPFGHEDGRKSFGFTNRDPSRPWPGSSSGDKYAPINENEFIQPEGAAALSTFSIDVDTASYTGVRQYLLDARRLPPAEAVRIEELVNYFDYEYTAPAADSEDPFTAAMEVAACPWKPEHQLVRIGIKGREIDAEKRPLSNLVFLIDVSGSMNQPNKLPLVVEGLKALTERLGENDRVAIVVYAGSEGVVLPSTSGTEKDAIRSALARLQAGGSTAGGAGLKLAYEIAERNKIPGGTNRVILCTDGDFNVGVTGTEELAKLVESRGKEQGIFLTVLGFGRGNLNDAMLETISGRGDGHYAYIDSEREARRVLSRDLSGTLVTIAKDVKLQVEFNPAKVAAYRLIGYENRVMAAKDFNDDTKDAGEIGAGHTVTALYEVVPVGVKQPAPPVDGLKYQQADGQTDSESRSSGSDQVGPSAVSDQRSAKETNELLTLKIRYKQPEGGSSKKLEFPLEAVDLDSNDLDGGENPQATSNDFRWAASVAEFGILLRHSRYAGEATFDSVLETARGSLGEDERGYRAEFLDLVRRAKELSGKE